MSSNNRSRGLAHGAPADVGLNGGSADGHHGHGNVSSEPVTVVVPGSVVALIVDVTEQVRHGSETPHARAGCAKILTMRRVVTLDVQQTGTEYFI